MTGIEGDKMGEARILDGRALAILTILKHCNIELEGKEAVVVGRSPISGNRHIFRLIGLRRALSSF